ncbi:MAG: hypothetical protein IJY48_06670 [Mailhella sp.]|nr:hypothetical protein [Mailhella sp.]
MKKYYILTCCVLSLFLAGCSTSSGVMELSPEIYSVSVDVDSEIYGLATAQKKAYTEARNYCQSQNKTLAVQNTEGHTNSFGYTNSTIIFRCID